MKNKLELPSGSKSASKTPKRQILYCEPCNHKEIVDEKRLGELYQIPTVPLCSGVPVYDSVEKKTIVPPAKEQTTKVRCPECGRAVVLKELPKPYLDEFTAKEKAEAEAKQEEAEKLARLADEQEQKLRQAGIDNYMEQSRRKK